MAGGTERDDARVPPPHGVLEGGPGVTADEEPHMERQVSQFASLASGEPAAPLAPQYHPACSPCHDLAQAPTRAPAFHCHMPTGATHVDGSSGSLDAALSKKLSLRSLDLEKAAPELRALSMRHSTEELQVVARLTSGAALRGTQGWPQHMSTARGAVCFNLKGPPQEG